MSPARKICFALIALALTLGLAEGALRLSSRLRNSGRFFIAGPDGRVRFAASGTVTSFARTKPAGGFRVFCFGESAVEGRIYMPRSSFPRLLEEMLRDRSRGGAVEVVNCGMTAQNSDRVLESFRAALAYQPDLMVVYGGNNEFFRHDRFGRYRHPYLYRARVWLGRHSALAILAKSLAHRLVDSAPGLQLKGSVGVQGPAFFDDRLRGYILNGFRKNLEDMAAMGRASGVPVLLAVPAINLAGWPPQRSVCNLGPEGCRELAQTLARAEQAIELGRLDQARALVEPVLAEEPKNALANFIAGRLDLAAGDTVGRTAAAERFTTAADEDDFCVARARPAQLKIIAEVSAASGLPLLDVQEIFRRRSPAGVVGYELLDDFCHPTLDGQALIAAALAQEISQAHPELFRPADRDELYSRRAEYLAREPLDPEYLSKRLQEMAFYLAFKFDHPLITARALLLLRRQRELYPGSVLLPVVEGLVRLRRAEVERARAAFERALRENPGHVGRLADFYFRRFLNWQPPWLWVRAHPGIDFNPILDDYLAQEGPDFLDRDHADRVYVLTGSTLFDVTTLPPPPRPSRLAPEAPGRL